VANANHQISASLPHGLDPPPPLDLSRLRDLVRRTKSAKALSIADLVMASGLSRTAVLDMLNGRGRVVTGRLDSWWALAWALGVPFGDLMGACDGAETRGEPGEMSGQ
jgi:transcriptional regulator with XRE-family HTH domain